MSLRAESLLSLVGLFPERIAKKDRNRSRAVPALWTKRVKEWFDEEAQKGFVYVAVPKKLDDLFEKLATEPQQAEVEAWVADIGFDDPELTSAEFFEAIKRARQYVVDAWPSISIDEGAGPRILPLSTDDAAELWSVFQVVNDPSRVLDEMDAWTLSPSQALAFRSCYPELFAHLDAAITDVVIAKRAKDQDYTPGYERDSVLRVLRGKPPELMPPAPPQATVEPAKVKIDKDEGLTQAETSARPRG